MKFFHTYRYLHPYKYYYYPPTDYADKHGWIFYTSSHTHVFIISNKSEKILNYYSI